MWNLEQGVAVIRKIEPHLASIGYHCGLTGSVIFKGFSEKDLDVIVYPHDNDSRDTEAVWNTLTALLAPEKSGKFGGVSQVRDTKDVRWMRKKDKRIDFFFL